MGYNYDIEHIEALRDHCRELGVWTAPAFWESSLETLQRHYNGIGPDAWSGCFRGLATRLLAPFEIAALPHDFDFATALRSYFAFTLANVRFAVNAILEAFHRHPLQFPLNRERTKELYRLAVMILCGLLLALLCQCCGWKGYRNTKL